VRNHQRPVVLIAEKLAPSVLEVFGDEADVRHVDGTDRPALYEAIADADALLVRSATRVDAEVLSHATRLTVVARAGVGLDNVDVPAATARGVMVVNAPTSNIVSAAEHAVALLLAVARRVPAADASLRGGAWQRSAFSGVELSGKTVGVMGLGKIGQLVAHRLAAFGTELIAYDPYVAPARAAQLGIELVDLDELLARSDFISIHLPKTPETLNLLGADQLAKTKPGVIIVNAARGVDDDDARLGLRELVGTEEIEGLRGLREMDGDEVRPRQQLVEVDQLDAELCRAGGRDVRVVGDELGAERRQPVGHELADLAEAHDADGLAGELHPGEGTALPCATAQAGVRRGHPPRDRKQQRHGVLGRRHDVRRRRVDDHHTARRRGGHVDVVQPDACARHHREPRRVGQDLGVDPGRRPDEQRVGVGDRLVERRAVRAVDVTDVGLVAEHLEHRGGELLGDEDDGSLVVAHGGLQAVVTGRPRV